MFWSGLRGAFQAGADAIATRTRIGGAHESGVGARHRFASERCDARGTRAGRRLVATVERGVPVLPCQSPADGLGRLASHGRERRAPASLLPYLPKAERARSRSGTD